MNDKRVINQNNVSLKVWRWLDEVVIGERFCPFAKQPRIHDTIRMSICDAKDTKEVLSALASECKYLDDNSDCETSLLVLSKALTKFDDYLFVLQLANELMIDLGYEGVYQLASFHPQYLFDGEPIDEISHYTNRSPYPIFHLIREASVSKALENVAEPELIPRRNIAHANTLGLAFFKRFL
jgi:hypothetical protein